MARYLKTGRAAEDVAEDDAKVRQTVEDILADVAGRGDVAVRELSQRFDDWAPETFRLTEQQIETAMGKVAKRDLEDIKIRPGAGSQFCATSARQHAGYRGRNAAGGRAGPQAYPCEQRRLLCAWRQIPDGCFCPYECRDGESRGRKTHHCHRATASGWAAPGYCCRDAYGRRR